MTVPQDQLLDGIVAQLPAGKSCTIDDDIKLRLAALLRRHYAEHPEALALQASGSNAPPAIDNHRP